MTEKLCKDCDVRPRAVGRGSYCRECHNARQRVSQARKRQDAAPRLATERAERKAAKAAEGPKHCKVCIDTEVSHPFLRLPGSSYCYDHRKEKNRATSRERYASEKLAREKHIEGETWSREVRLELEELDAVHGPMPPGFGTTDEDRDADEARLLRILAESPEIPSRD